MRPGHFRARRQVCTTSEPRPYLAVPLDPHYKDHRVHVQRWDCSSRQPWDTTATLHRSLMDVLPTPFEDATPFGNLSKHELSLGIPRYRQWSESFHGARIFKRFEADLR